MQQLTIEQAQLGRRALANWRKRQGRYQSLARALTRNPKTMVKPTSGAPCTTPDGTIYSRVSLAFALEPEHDRPNCLVRDEDHILVCPACKLDEAMDIDLYHEISHQVHESFTALDINDLTVTAKRAVSLLPHADQAGSRGAKLLRRIQESGDKVNNYVGLARLVSPHMPMLLNALEDSRVNRLLIEARPGVADGFQATTQQIFREGVERPDGTRQMWSEMPANLQALIAVESIAEGYEYQRWLDPEVVAAVQDYKLFDLIDRLNQTTTIREVFSLAFPILERLRELGFFVEDDDPQDDPPPMPPLPSDQKSDDSDSGEGDLDNEGDTNDADQDSTEESDGGEPDPGQEQEGDAGSSADSDSVGDPEGDDESPEGDSAEGDPDADDAPDGDGGSELPDGDPAAGDQGDADSGNDAEPEEGSGDGSPGDEGDPSEDGDSGSSDESGGSDADGSAGDDGGGEPADGSGEPSMEGSPDGEPDGAGEPAPSQESHGDPRGDPDDADGMAADGALDSDEGSSDDAPGSPGDATAGDRPVGQPYRGDLEMGEPGSLQEDFNTFAGHNQDGTSALAPVPETVEGMDPEDQEVVVNLAILQQDFDAPSLEVGGFELHRNGSGECWERHNPASMPDLEVSELVLGPAVRDLRLVFTDNRRHKVERNLKRGRRIDGKVLARRVPFDDQRVFHKRTIPGKKDYFVLIVIDMSSSTELHHQSHLRGTIREGIKTAAFAKAEMLDRIGIPFALYAHSAGGNHHAVQYFEIKSPDEAWSREAKERLRSIGGAGYNLDGHALEQARKMLQARREKVRLLMYYSDGEMPMSNYDEELELLQHNVALMKREGIHVVGVGWQTDSPSQHGLDTVQVNSIEEVGEVVKKLKTELMNG